MLSPRSGDMRVSCDLQPACDLVVVHRATTGPESQFIRLGTCLCVCVFACVGTRYVCVCTYVLVIPNGTKTQTQTQTHTHTQVSCLWIQGSSLLFSLPPPPPTFPPSVLRGGRGRAPIEQPPGRGSHLLDSVRLRMCACACVCARVCACAHRTQTHIIPYHTNTQGCR